MNHLDTDKTVNASKSGCVDDERAADHDVKPTPIGERLSRRRSCDSSREYGAP